MAGSEQDALFRLDGQVAIITGAGAGIGRAITKVFGRAGAKVTAADINPALAEATAAAIVAEGGEAIAVVGDITSEEGAAQICEVAMNAFGRIDVLVNNAGIYPPAPRLPEIDWPVMRQTFEVNVFGSLKCISEAARRMQPGGRIVNISSMESLRPSGPQNLAYSTTKAALNGVTRAAAVDLGPLGIRVNAVLPGLIRTEGTSRIPEALFETIAAHAPSGRAGQPEDIAHAVLFLASPASAYVNGHCLVVDGGTTIVG